MNGLFVRWRLWPGRPKATRCLLLGTVLAGLAGLTGCKESAAEPVPAETPRLQVRIAEPRRGSITRFVTLPGQIEPYQRATLFAKVAGYLKTIHVDKGDQVRQGMLLAELEVPELLAEQTRRKAEVEVAEIDFRRLSESQKKAPDLVVPQTVDDARGKWDVAKANLEGTETLLNYARITAPFSGVITRRFVDPGAFIPAATTGSTPQSAAIVTLTDFGRVRVQVAVPELEAARVAVGEAASLSVEGLPGRVFEGKVTRYAYALDEATKTMLAEIELPNPSLELRPGMYAVVRIGIERKEDALLVPADALVTEKAGASVFVVSRDVLKKTRVEPGFNDGERVEITKGLDAGQPVVLVGSQALKDGQAVTTTEGK